VTGTLAGMRRGYDIIGVFALAFVTAVGGGLIRDGIFIQAGPPAVLTGLHYLPVIIAAVLGTIIIDSAVPPVRRILSGVPAPAVRAEPPVRQTPSEYRECRFDSGILNGGWRGPTQPCCLWWMRSVWVSMRLSGCRNLWMPPSRFQRLFWWES